MTFEIRIKKPFSFVDVMKTHGWFQLPPFYWLEQEKELRWAVRVGRSPQLVRLRPAKDKAGLARVLCEVDNPAIQDIIEQKFRYIFNLHLDLHEFYDLCNQEPLLAQVPQRGIGRLMRAESLFEDVFKSICGTNVQWKQAVKMIHNIAVLGDVVPGTEYHLFPTPQQVLAAGENFLRTVGRVGYRSSYLMDLAARFDTGEEKAEIVQNGGLPAAELKKYFLSFKGIGKTTAHYLMALYGHFDEMAVDSLVLNYMSATHFNGATPTETQVKQFYDRFGSWRYLAYWMEFIINKGWNPDG